MNMTNQMRILLLLQDSGGIAVSDTKDLKIWKKKIAPAVFGVDISNENEKGFCSTFTLKKLTLTNFPWKTPEMTEPTLDFVHTKVYGPFKSASESRALYFTNNCDKHTR